MMDERISTTYDRTGRLIAVSRSFVAAFGAEVEAFIGERPPFPWWPEQQRTFLSERLEGAISEEGRAYDGIEIILTLRPMTGSPGLYVVSSERLPNGNTMVFSRPLIEVESVAKAVEMLREGLLGTRSATDASAAERGQTQMLSPRECDVYLMLLEGKPTARIAEDLFISIHTVRNHRSAIYRKLGVSSQIELIRAISPG